MQVKMINTGAIFLQLFKCFVIHSVPKTWQHSYIMIPELDTKPFLFSLLINSLLINSFVIHQMLFVKFE